MIAKKNNEIKNELEDLFIKISSHFKTENIIVSSKIQNGENIQLPNTIIEKIKNKKDNSEQCYFIKDNRNQMALIFTNGNHTALFFEREIYFFNSLFQEIFSVNNIINNHRVGSFYSENCAGINMLDSHLYAPHQLSNFKIKNEKFSNITCHFSFENLKKFVFMGKRFARDFLLEASFEPRYSNPDQINVSFNNSIIDKLILDLNGNPIHIVLAYNFQKDLNLEKGHYDIKNYGDIIKIINDSLELYLLSSDKKIPIISEKKFKHEISKVKILLNSENKSIFLNVSQKRKDIVEYFEIIEKTNIDFNQNKDIYMYQEKALISKEQPNIDTATFFKILHLIDKKEINILDKSLIEKAESLNNNFNIINNNFDCLLEKESIKIKGKIKKGTTP